MKKEELARKLDSVQCIVKMKDGKEYTDPKPINGMMDDSLFLTLSYDGGKEVTININEIDHIDWLSE